METEKISPSQLTSEAFSQFYSHLWSYLFGTCICSIIRIIAFCSLFVAVWGTKSTAKILHNISYLLAGIDWSETLKSLLEQLTNVDMFSLIIACIIFLIVHYRLQFGYYKFIMTLHNTSEHRFTFIFFGFKKTLSFAVASIIYLGIVVFGLALFVIPGIYWAIRLSYYPHIILEKNASPLTALKESYSLTHDKFPEIFKTRMLAWLKSWGFIIRSFFFSSFLLILLTGILFLILALVAATGEQREVSGLVPLLAYVIVGVLVMPSLLWVLWLCARTYRQIANIKIYQLLSKNA